jgi:hypothetical protein
MRNLRAEMRGPSLLSLTAPVWNRLTGRSLENSRMRSWASRYQFDTRVRLDGRRVDGITPRSLVPHLSTLKGDDGL